MKRSRETVAESQISATWRRARVTATFNRRWSERKPTVRFALLRTREMITASFSRPWNPSTLSISSSPYRSRSRRRRSSTWALYGEMTARSPGLSPSSIRRSTWAATISISPGFARDSSSSLSVSSRSQPAVSISSRGKSPSAPLATAVHAVLHRQHAADRLAGPSDQSVEQSSIQTTPRRLDRMDRGRELMVIAAEGGASTLLQWYPAGSFQGLGRLVDDDALEFHIRQRRMRGADIRRQDDVRPHQYGSDDGALELADLAAQFSGAPSELPAGAAFVRLEELSP